MLRNQFSRVGQFTGDQVDPAIRLNCCQAIRQVIETPQGQAQAGGFLLEWCALYTEASMTPIAFLIISSRSCLVFANC
jgi:hypothetical protein